MDSLDPTVAIKAVELALRMLPLPLLVALGFFVSRKLKVQKESIATLLVYVITPLVVFNGVVSGQLDTARLSLPVIIYATCCLLSALSLFMAKKFFTRPALNILAYSGGNCNSGYFGLPVAVALLGEKAFTQAVLISFGFIFFENTMGYYLTARGHHTRAESLKKLIRLPSIYALILGLFFNKIGMHGLGPMQDILANARASYTFLGMMLIGMAIGDLKVFEIDWKFCSFAWIFKFLVWPIAMAVLVFADAHSFQILDSFAVKGLIVAAFLPMAANTVAFSTVFKAEPEKSSVAVFFSTLIAFAILPVVIFILGLMN